MNTALYKKLLLRIGAIIYTLIAAEGFLRVFAPVPMLPRYVCRTPYGIRGNTPDISYRHTTPEYKIKIHINSKGMRSDREIPYEKPKNIKRIVLLGDSYGMGYGVEYEQMFSTRLIEHLASDYGIQAEVVNLSVSGHGNAEELTVLNAEGWKYDPDLVILQWHGSDLSDNIRSNLYGLENGQLVPRAKEYLPGVETREFLFQFYAYRLVAGHSQLYGCLREKAAELVKYRILPAIRKLSNPSLATNKTDSDVNAPQTRYSERLVMALLTEIQSQCQKHDAGLVILDIPSWRSRTEFESRFPYCLNDEGKLKVVNLKEKLETEKGRKLFWEKAHFHLTPLGCELAGEALAECIIKNHLLE